MEQQKQTTTQLHQGRRVPRKKKGRRIVAVLAGLICLGAAAVAYGYFGPNFLLPYKSGYVHVLSLIHI